MILYILAIYKIVALEAANAREGIKTNNAAMFICPLNDMLEAANAREGIKTY